MSEIRALNVSALAGGIGGKLATIQWLLGHSGDLPALLDALRLIQSAGTVREKWEAIKAAGDVLIGWADAPVAKSFASVAEHDEYEATVVAQARAMGVDWAALLALAKYLPAIFSLLQQVLGAIDSVWPSKPAPSATPAPVDDTPADSVPVSDVPPLPAMPASVVEESLTDGGSRYQEMREQLAADAGDAPGQSANAVAETPDPAVESTDTPADAG